MKKLVSSLCGIVIALIAMVGGVTLAYASSNEEESDLVFFKAFEYVLAEESITEENIKIDKEPLYDIKLNQLGYFYTMDLGAQNGFALVINTDGTFIVSEIYLDAENPYKNYTGKKIYVSALFYLVYENEKFLETTSNLALDEEILLKLEEAAFYSGNNAALIRTEETIHYTNRVVKKHELTKRHPSYIVEGVLNACTPTAGGNIIGYYTRYFPELMPGFTPGNFLGTHYLYKEISAEAVSMVNDLYNYMGTNLKAPGTTIDGFKSGMTKFCNVKGRNISFSSNMKNNTFDYSLTKQRFEAGLPAVFFVDTFTVNTINNSSTDKKDSMQIFIGSLCHAMAGFGYNEITYTLANGQVRTDKYIAVATGLAVESKGYFNIGKQTQIDEALSINIY